MKKSRIFGLVVLSIMVLFLSGCSKSVKTSNDFKSIADKNGLVTVDVTSQYATYGTFKEAYVAQSNDGWQIEFFVLNKEEHAISMFETNKKIFEGYKEDGSSSYSEVNGSNYNKYSLNTGGYYMYICRVENTLVYLRVSDQYKDTVKGIIKSLGY